MLFHTLDNTDDDDFQQDLDSGKLDYNGEDRLEDPTFDENVGDETIDPDGTITTITAVGETEIIELVWDCSCGTQCKGSAETCSACNANKPLDVAYYKTKDSRVVTDLEEINEAMSGPEWECTGCQTMNDFNNTACSKCGTAQNPGGAMKNSLNATYTKSGVKERNEQLDDTDDVLAGAGEASAAALKDTQHILGNPRSWAITAGVILFLIVAFRSYQEYVLRTTYRTKNAKITSMPRVTQKTAKQLFEATGQGWDYPSDAFNIDSSYVPFSYKSKKVDDVLVTYKVPRKIYKGEKTVMVPQQFEGEPTPIWDSVIVDYKIQEITTMEQKNLGNGYAMRRPVTKQIKKPIKERQIVDYEKNYITRQVPTQVDDYETIEIDSTVLEPVMEKVPDERAYKYIYSVPEWRSVTPYTASGQNSIPQWADVTENSKLKITGKNGTYEICVATPQNSGCFPVPYSDFISNLELLGDSVPVTVNGRNNIISLGAYEGEQ